MQTTISVNRTESGHRIQTNRDELKKYTREIESLLDNDLTEGESILIKAIKSSYAGLSVTIEVKDQDSNSILRKAKETLLSEWIDYFEPEDYSPVKAAKTFCREMPLYKDLEKEIEDFIKEARKASKKETEDNISEAKKGDTFSLLMQAVS